MKKLFLLTILTIFSFTVAQSQSNWKLGVNAGIPVGDIEDFSSFNLGGDVAYFFDVSDVFTAGPLVGFSHFFEDDDGVGEDLSFIPLAASGRFSFSDAVFIGADLGYAIGVDDGNDGGFYYRPKLGYNFGMVALILSYAGIEITDGPTAGTVNLGIEIGF